MSRLEGLRPLLTRSAEDAAQWAQALTAEGASPRLLPCITTELADDPGIERRLAAAVAVADWIVFTSKRGVEAFGELRGAVSPAAKLAAVGDVTAAALTAALGRADLVGPGTAAGLAALLAERSTPGENVVLALAANADDRLERALAKAGAIVTRVDLYRTIPSPPATPKRALSSLDCDAVIFASPTAVTGFANQVNVDIPGHFVTIGPSTSQAVRARGWQVAAEAKRPGLPGIIESLLEADHVRNTA